MKNYHKQFGKLFISWFNIKNLPEDAYIKKYNNYYQKYKKEYFKKVFHFMIGEYGIEWQNTYFTTALIFITPGNLLWFIFRESDDLRSRKGTCTFRITRHINDQYNSAY